MCVKAPPTDSVATSPAGSVRSEDSDKVGNDAAKDFEQTLNEVSKPL